MNSSVSRTVKRICAVIFLAAITASCGGGGSGGDSAGGSPPGGDSATYTAGSGLAQKGPLIKGSTVTAQQLNTALSPTGQEFTYEVTSNLGNFAPSSTFTSQYLGLNANGYYFDEVQNAVSSGQVTLSGYSDLAVDKVLNVNLLTTLAYQRILTLVTGSGLGFVAARTEAENEVLAALNIPPGSYGTFGTLDLSGSTDGDHILAAVSSLFVYGNSAGPLSQLIANFQSDIGANGVITSASTKAQLIAAAEGINPSSVAANLTAEYTSEGLSFTAANLSEWIARSGDGVIGKFAFQVPDATPSTVFTFPSFVAAQYAGSSISATSGQLSVNGTPANQPVTVSSGDVLTLSPLASQFPNGVLTIYLVSGSTNIAKVAFVSGLVSIAVTPPTPSLPVGVTQQFTATGTFSDTSTANLTNSVTWATGAPSIAAVNSASGLATAMAVGSTTIAANSGSVSGTATVTVSPAVVQSIAITPNPATSGVGLSLQLSATGTYTNGTTADITTTAKWASSTPSIATVGPTTGLISGVALGSTTISAAIGAVTGTAPLSILSNAWAATGSLLTARYQHTATLLPNGKVLVAGGIISYQNQVPTASAELYDPASGTWTPTGSLATARYGHTATLLQNGLVLVTGGVDSAGTPISGAELYDPAAGSWSAAGSLIATSTSLLATLLPNGSVLVAGGFDSTTNLDTAAQLYNPTAGTWSATGNLLASHDQGTATLLQNGTVLVEGVDQSTVPPQPVYAEIYDPGTGTWSATGNMVGSTPLQGSSATLLPNGQVLLAGGYNQVYASSNAQLYDPNTGTWTATGNMSAARSAHTATLLPNGTVLVAAGDNTNYVYAQPTAEIYNPATGTWSSAGTLVTPVFYQTATLLPNGVVLVAGGDTGDVMLPQAPTSAAELYW